MERDIDISWPGAGDLKVLFGSSEFRGLSVVVILFCLTCFSSTMDNLGS